MEAGDCEGRSASAFFLPVVGDQSVVGSQCQLYSTRLLATFFNQAEITKRTTDNGPLTTDHRAMNIGITVYPTYGGSGIVGSELGKELAARGHTVHFISSSLPTRLTELNERVRFHEVEMMSYPLFEHQPYTLALATKMATVAETENLDLLHVHYAIPHSISAILARESLKPKRRLPVITTLHGTDITLVGADRSYLPITRYGIVQSDGVTAISHYLKEATKEIFQFDDIEVIPNFICQTDYARHPVENLRAALSPAGEPLLVHVSNFRPVKRPVDCVEILARVLKKESPPGW